jgi:hypothetical protein
VDSYAGFAGDAPVLEPMWQRALAGERLDDELPIYASGRLWAFVDSGAEAQARAWRGTPEAMAAYYREQAATLRPGTFARLHLNAWASGEEAFVTAEEWDACVAEDMTPMLEDRQLAVSAGVDASTKGDAAAVVAVAKVDGKVRLVAHRVWRPSKDDPLDLEETIEAYLLELRSRFRLAAVMYDPMQMHRSAVTLAKAGVPMCEFPQTSANLTAAGQNLYELIRGRNLVAYPDAELRSHVLDAVAVDTGRGWRLAKEKASRKIDGAAALSFAALDSIDRSTEPAGVAGVVVPQGYEDDDRIEMGRLGAQDSKVRDPRGSDPHREENARKAHEAHLAAVRRRNKLNRLRRLEERDAKREGRAPREILDDERDERAVAV